MQKTAMTALGFFLLATPALAQKTGLKSTTKKELISMQKDLGMRRIRDVKPNALGLTRANAERKKRGLSSLQETARAYGKETVVDQELNDFSGGATPSGSDFFAGVLPAQVDNSKLAAFPPIGNQTVNNCVGWAMGYYQQSHNLALTLGYANNTTDQTTKCSPKFLYNMINSGVDNGAYFSDAFMMLQKHGCISKADLPENSDFKSWDLNPDHWQNGISRRTNPVQYIYNVDTQAGLDQMKQILTIGYVLTYGTYINSWQYTTIKGGALAGQKVMHWMNGQNGGHAMTIVGYDDSAWVDINNNNIQDAGEMGAFKIANSWGTSWGISGYMWVAYDALKSVSAVSGGPSTGRVAAFQGKVAYHMVPRATAGNPYKPKYLAKFTVNHALRNQMSVKFGNSDMGYTTATNTFNPFALFNKGGAMAFNGTTTPVDGTFVIDVSDLPISTTAQNKVYLSLGDTTSGSAATLKSFILMDQVTSTQASAALAGPVSADGSTATVSLVHDPYNSNASPIANFTANNYSGAAPLYVAFDAASSYDPDGTILSYNWTFGDGSSASGAYVTHTYNAGSYSATLTVTDDRGVSNSKTVTISSQSVTPPPTGDTTVPVITLTSPANGASIKRFTYFTATASASDNVAVTKVNFYYRGSLKCTDTTAPYSCSIRMVNGSGQSVYARAYDAAGNYRTSATSYVNAY
ncbi:MAG: PKD domain-containing protein [Bdellovibrionota bacterium]